MVSAEFMTRHSKIVFIVLILYFLSCSAPLNIVEINGIQKVAFEPLYIQNDIELYDLRIDIIRQTYEEQVNDSTTETREVPYHMIGFNLGNGLFFDLNNNLSLRIDKLLKFDSGNDFRMERTFVARKSGSIIYSSVNDTFLIEFPQKGKTYNRFSVERFKDSINININNKYRYSIKKDDSTMMYMNNKQTFDKIYKKEENHYYQIYKKRVAEYKLTDGEVILNSRYKIFLNQDKNIIGIISIGKRSDIELYKIIRDENKIFIYNNRYYGKKIEINMDKLVLYNNNKLQFEYRLID